MKSPPLSSQWSGSTLPCSQHLESSCLEHAWPAEVVIAAKPEAQVGHCICSARRSVVMLDLQRQSLLQSSLEDTSRSEAMKGACWACIRCVHIFCVLRYALCLQIAAPCQHFKTAEDLNIGNSSAGPITCFARACGSSARACETLHRSTSLIYCGR